MKFLIACLGSFLLLSVPAGPSAIAGYRQRSGKFRKTRRPARECSVEHFTREKEAEESLDQRRNRLGQRGRVRCWRWQILSRKSW